MFQEKKCVTCLCRPTHSSVTAWQMKKIISNMCPPANAGHVKCEVKQRDRLFVYENWDDRICILKKRWFFSKNNNCNNCKHSDLFLYTGIFVSNPSSNDYKHQSAEIYRICCNIIHLHRCWYSAHICMSNKKTRSKQHHKYVAIYSNVTNN